MLALLRPSKTWAQLEAIPESDDTNGDTLDATSDDKSLAPSARDNLGTHFRLSCCRIPFLLPVPC